jgi:ribosome-associated toxin RatA of RatAB toxin-antitoxin module
MNPAIPEREAGALATQPRRSVFVTVDSRWNYEDDSFALCRLNFQVNRRFMNSVCTYVLYMAISPM